MKIGIVTLPLHINFGGFLQNYALQQVLMSLGHEPITLNQRPRKKKIVELFNGVVKPNIKTLALSVIGKKGQRKYEHFARKSLRPILWEESTRFYNRFIIHTPPLNPQKDFNTVCGEYSLDAVITGSDQVWRPRYVENLRVNYLGFVPKGVKKLAYAASFGTDKWEYEDRDAEKCKELIKDFTLLTVREESAVGLCKEHFSVTSYQTLDPTLLLEKEDYEKLYELEKEPKSPGSLFCYVLDTTPKKKKLIAKIATEIKQTPFYVNIGESTNHYSKKYILSHIEQFKNPSVTKWLRSFADAEMVIADSFHAVAFSIIFNKPFWVIGNKERGLSRFTSILKMFHLENRLLDEDVQLGTHNWKEPIDWDEVNCIRQQWKAKSISLLEKGLS